MHKKVKPTFKQLELDLWGDLKTALDEPETANFQQLWQELERAIAPMGNYQQLQVAAEATSQIVEIYVSRANGIFDSLEVTDNSDGPVLDDDFLSGLMRQFMSIDLSDMMEEFSLDVEDSPVIFGSVVVEIDRKAARALARKARAEVRKALKALAEQENIPQWQSVIASWMQQHQGEKVSLWQLQQALGMPLVEIWLGLLHSPTLYQWDGQEGNFYREARDIWFIG